MNHTYKTIQSPSEGIFKDKGSKFLAFAFPVSSLDEIKEILTDYKKRYFDARHVCYAYMLGSERTEFRSNDDGEPSGTAGRPILGQINSNELTDILLIVVRYFGGVLLGTGGLVQAYKLAANDAINNAEIIEKTVYKELNIEFAYERINDVMQAIRTVDCKVKYQNFDNICMIKLEVCITDYDILQSKLLKITSL